MEHTYYLRLPKWFAMHLWKSQRAYIPELRLRKKSYSIYLTNYLFILID